MKKVKTQNYFIIDAFTSESRDQICIKSDSEIREIKNSDISIMDSLSTGSIISKYMVEKVFIKASLIKLKEAIISSQDEDDDTKDSVNEVKEEVKPEVKEFTLDDFIDDFKI